MHFLCAYSHIYVHAYISPPLWITDRITLSQLITIHCLLSMASLAWVIMYWRQVGALGGWMPFAVVWRC